MKKLPKITKKQQEIVELLYRYRFLNRIQIQSFLGHADKRRIIAWLKDLREKDYVQWIYSTEFTEKSKPAIYYVSINGVRYLKTHQREDDTALYPLEELRKRYKDNQRSRTFIDRSILVADCGIALKAANNRQEKDATTKVKVRYGYLTEADYIHPDHNYHFLAELEILRPHLYIQKQKGRITTSYWLEIFNATLPRYRLRSHLKAYVKYLDDGEREQATGADNPPVILLALSNLYDLIYAKRSVRKLLLDTYYEAEAIPKNVHIRFTTAEQLKLNDITAEVWEEGPKRAGL